MALCLMPKGLIVLSPLVGKMLVFFKDHWVNCYLSWPGEGEWIIFKTLFLDQLKSSVIKTNACIAENIFSPWGMVTLNLGRKMIGPGLDMAGEIYLCSHLLKAKLNCEIQFNSIHPAFSDWLLSAEFMLSFEDTEISEPQFLPLRNTCPVGEAYM